MRMHELTGQVDYAALWTRDCDQNGQRIARKIADSSNNEKQVKERFAQRQISQRRSSKQSKAVELKREWVSFDLRIESRICGIGGNDDDDRFFLMAQGQQRAKECETRVGAFSHLQLFKGRPSKCVASFGLETCFKRHALRCTGVFWAC